MTAMPSLTWRWAPGASASMPWAISRYAETSRSSLAATLRPSGSLDVVVAGLLERGSSSYRIQLLKTLRTYGNKAVHW